MKVRTLPLLWGVTSALWAQIDEDRPISARHPVLKLYPLAMIDIFQYTLHAAVEFPTSQHSSLQVEGGWVFGDLGSEANWGTTEEDFSQRGFKARLLWREYFSEKPPKKPTYTHTGGYLAFLGGFQYYAQNLGYIDTTSVWPPPQPAPQIPYERTIHALSVGFWVGYQAQIGSRLVIDVYGGMGVRYAQHLWKPAKPPYRDLRFTPVGDLIVRPGGRPVPYMGFSLGWILR